MKAKKLLKNDKNILKIGKYFFILISEQNRISLFIGAGEY